MILFVHKPQFAQFLLIDYDLLAITHYLILMAQDFKPIFDYLDEMKSELTKDITTSVTASLGGKIDKLQTSVDGFAKDVKKFDQERLAQNNRIEKLETWAKPIGDKLQMPLVQ